MEYNIRPILIGLFYVFNLIRLIFNMQAKISHKKYGICKMPAITDKFKKYIIIARTRNVRINAIIKALISLCSKKKALVQYKFTKSCMRNIEIQIYLVIDCGVNKIIIKEIPISKNSIDQTYLKAHFGGWNFGLFNLLKKSSS